MDDKNTSSAFAAAAAELAAAKLRAAKAQRANADALEKAAKALESDARAAKDALDALEQARKNAQSQADALRSQARGQALDALLEAAKADSGRFPVAIQFEHCGLAATRKHGADRSAWKKGQAFELIPEPTNPHDPNAVKVMQGGKQVGYLAKEDAQKLAKMRERDGWELSGSAHLIERKGGRWDEGVVGARLQNPIMGWAGYNPGLPLEQNIVAMERELFTQASAAAPAPKSRAPSL